MRRFAHSWHAGYAGMAVLLTSAMLAGGAAVSVPHAANAAAPAASTTLTVAPTTVDQGGTITITATGFTPNEAVTIHLSGMSKTLATFTSTGTGDLSGKQVTLPNTAPTGSQTLTAEGVSSHHTDSATLTVTALTATLTAAPTTVDQGGTVTVSGTNWTPTEPITLDLSGVSSPLTVAHAGTSGDLPSTSVTIPYNAPTGSQTLTATGATSKRTAKATLTVNAVSASLLVTPTTTNRGGLIDVSGSHFAPNEAITLTVSGVITPLATITATAQGALPETGVSIPYSIAAGSYTLQAKGATSGHTATIGLTIQHLAPSITLSQTQFSPGNTVTVKGSGFGRQEQVTLSLNGAALTTSPSPITTTNGAFTASVVIPKSLLRGANTISAIGNESRVSGSINVTGVLPVATTVYFAGANTTSGHTAEIPILNTNDQPAHIDLTFYYQGGGTGQASLDVPAHSRGTADLNALAGGRPAFGIKLSADRFVTAQLRETRPGMDGYGILGVAAPDKTWYLAEGYTGLTFHESLDIVNPGTAAAQVQLRLLPFNGRPPRNVTVTAGPQSTMTVNVNSLMPNQSLSIIAHASQPIVLARVMTFSTHGYGVTAKTGTNTPATSWIFAEGTTTTRFQTFLTILNPNTVPTLVTASFYGQTGGSLGSRTMEVAPKSRANLKLNNFLHASGIASVVTSNLPIVVERPEYFGSPNGMDVAGSDVFGRNGAGLSWAFPGGDTSGRSEFLLIYNPSPKTVDITADFYGSNGSQLTKTLFVPPTVRYNVNVNALVPTLTAQHSIVLKSTNGLGFVAEQTIFAPNFSTLHSTQGFAQ